MAISDALYELQFLFAKATKTIPATKAEIIRFILDQLDGASGIAIGEEHGPYCYPRFIGEHAQEFFDHGVRGFCTEILPRHKQYLFDAWQDYEDPAPLITFLNSIKYANSSYQHQNYMDMFQKLKDAGIRLHATRLTRDPRKPFSMQEHNQEWLNAIDSARAWHDADTKLMLFGGQHHLRAKFDNVPGVAQSLGIPTIQLMAGDFAILKSPVTPHEHFARIPLTADHISSFRSAILPSRAIAYPGQN